MKKTSSVVVILGIVVCMGHGEFVSAASPQPSPQSSPQTPPKASSVEVDPAVKALVELAGQGNTQ